MTKLIFLAAFIAQFISQAAGHPGEVHDLESVNREIYAREFWANEAARSIKKCSTSSSARDLEAINIERRANTVRTLREERGIKTATRKLKRTAADLAKWEAINHNKTDVDYYTAKTPETKIFGGITSAILAPIVTDGPYYVWGEMIRKNVVEKLYSDGIPLHLEVQYYNVETCKPVPGVYVDIWNANATGVYSGISTSGNYAADGYNSTYLRGIQETDKHGVATFNTIFPGHYDGRATHTHLLAHTNVTVLANKTLLIDTGTVVHIGQLFWNEVLRSAVEATYPYSTNTQAVTSNADDMWSVVQASSTYDPFPEFLYLGDTIEDGLFAWKQIGLNMSADYNDNSYYEIAAYREADGGQVNTAGGNGGSGGGSGGGSVSGSVSGSGLGSGMPSGTAPPGSGSVIASTTVQGTTAKTTSSASKTS